MLYLSETTDFLLIIRIREANIKTLLLLHSKHYHGNSNSMNLKVKEIITNPELKAFINYPKILYKDHPCWIPPLDFDERNTLMSSRNPSFEFCKARFWMVYRDNVPVGRIAGIINTKSNETWKEKKIRFGWFDCIDDSEVAGTLTGLVEQWGRESGLTSIHGPLGFTDMDKEGMLLNHFDEISTIATLYNYPYYPDLLKQLGFLNDADWIQYEVNIPDAIPERLVRISDQVAKRYNLRVLQAGSKRELLRYAPQMFEVLNNVYSHLYGFVKLSQSQVDFYIRQYFGFIRKEYVCFVLDPENQVIGFAIAFPSLSKAFMKAKGHLFPLGFIHILKALKFRNVTLDLYLIGVHPKYQNKGVTSMVFRQITEACIRNGVKRAVTNPQLVNNNRVLHLWDDYPVREIALRTCFNKPIS